MNFFRHPAVAALPVGWWSVDNGQSTSFGAGQTFSEIMSQGSLIYANLQGSDREKFVDRTSGTLRDYAIGLHENAKAVNEQQSSRLVAMFGDREVVRHFLENYGPTGKSHPPLGLGDPTLEPSATSLSPGETREVNHPPLTLNPGEKWTSEPHQPEFPREFGAAKLLSTSTTRLSQTGHIVCTRLLDFEGIEGRVLSISTYEPDGSDASTTYQDATRLEIWERPRGYAPDAARVAHLENTIVGLLGRPDRSPLFADPAQSPHRPVDVGKYSIAVPPAQTVSELSQFRQKVGSVVSASERSVLHPQISTPGSGAIIDALLQ
jgi:hypothetical protein